MTQTASIQSARHQLIVEATAPLPTRHGHFTVTVFRYTDDPTKEHVAIVAGDVAGMNDVPVRLHSECLTSEVLGSLKCDCNEQLEHAMRVIADEGCGVVLYLRQEGRGIGLANKIRAYALQARGVDTVDANRSLGLPDDAREYDAVRDILDDLRISSLRLMTNIPRKVAELSRLGIVVAERVPVITPPNSEYSASYIRAKAERMAHMFDGL